MMILSVVCSLGHMLKMIVLASQSQPVSCSNSFINFRLDLYCLAPGLLLPGDLQKDEKSPINR